MDKNFVEKYDAGQPQLIWTDIPTDLDTPVSCMLKLIPTSSHHMLLESVEGGETRSRYSIIALDPDIIWRCIDGKAQLNRNITCFEEATDDERFLEQDSDVFDSLRKLVKESRIDIPDELPPMASGIFGYMSYDMIKLMENLPDDNPDNIGIPLSIYIRPRVTVIFDTVKDEALIITPVWPDDNVHAETAFENAHKRIEATIKSINSPIPEETEFTTDIYSQCGDFKSHVTQDKYHEMVDKAKEYIVAGDIFQVVPSRRFSCDFPFSPFAFYRSLRRLNPSSHIFYLTLGYGKDGFSIIGSSPEILVRLKDDTVAIRPIAGTRKRGANKEEDQALAEELLSDKKECAEHLMLLDLGRNDVGRVAQPGTVKVTEHMIIERYSHVMHIVSNVEGKISDDKDCIDALIAGFPAGTVSGAPKIRAMEIIDELEEEKRGFYGGTVGYFSANGSMDTCIALRTGLIKDGKLYLQAGGGVVADSDPEAEFEETQNKANALIVAAGQATKYI